MRGLVRLIFSFLIGLFANTSALNAAWEAPVDISENGASSVSAVVKGGPNGTSYAVWSRFDGHNYIIQSARLEESGQWSNSENISLPGNDAFFADLAIDRKENVIVVWSRKQDSQTVIQASYKLVGEEWSNPVNLSGNEIGSGNASSPKIVLGSKNEVYVIWQKKINNQNVIQFATLNGFDQDWSAPFTISSNNNHNAVKPELAIAPNGDLFAMWIDSTSQSVQVASKMGKSNWGMPVALSVAGQPINNLQLAFNLSGDATAVWSRSNGSNHVIQVVQKTNGQSWSSPVDLSERDQDAISPDLAVDLLGNILVVWQRNDSVYTIIQAATKRNKGNWSKVIDLTNGYQDASQPKCFYGNSHSPWAVWKISDGSNFVIQSLLGEPDNNWKKPSTISLTGEDAVDPRMGVDGLGRPIVIWQRSDGSNSIIQAAINPPQE